MAASGVYALTFAAAALVHSASAQDLNEQVWGVFAFTLHGDSIPAVLPQPKALTPYGAGDLHAAGSAFRSRYVAVQGNNDSSSTRIESLSPYVLDTGEIEVLSTTSPSDVASAQAFMQGLYPPLNETYTGTYVDFSLQLANGSTITAPLKGYQYPRILTLSSDDPRSLTVDGQSSCLMHQVANAEYRSSPEVQEIAQTSEAFYNNLYNQALSGVLDRSSANYQNAYHISEFLDYQYVHNETLLHHLNRDEIELARSYADQSVFAMNGNTSYSSAIESPDIRTIAGRTLAANILDTFDKNVHYRGTDGKMTLVFGGPEPVVALTSLLQLASTQNSNFYSRPMLGGSVILELYSLESAANPTYPDQSQLYVRFLMRNGTDSPEFRAYPLFGHSPSSLAIPYTEFQAELEKFALGSTREWCLQCASEAVFCSGVLEREQNSPSTDNGKGLRPAVAGVIGAVVTLAALAIIGIIGFLIFGFRTNRFHRSALKGFKGSSKMASDPDIAFKSPTWEDVKPTTDQDPQNPGATGTIVRGHERSGSWELKNQNGDNDVNHAQGDDAVSPFDDDNEEEWRTHSVLQAVTARGPIPGLQPLPRPSPHTPIQSCRPILSQSNDGFQQFVKAHSSPKHQRVTAGGRIVPMEPQLAVSESSFPQAGELEAREHEPFSSENTPTQAMHTDPSTGNKLDTHHVAPVDLPDLRQQPIPNNDLCQSLHTLGFDVGYGPGCAPIFPPVTPAPGMFLQPNVPVEYRSQQYAHRAECLPQPCYQPVLSDPHMYGVGVLGVDTPTWYPNVYPVMNTQSPVAPLPPAIQSYNSVAALAGFIPGHHHRTAMAPSKFGQYAQYPTPPDTCYAKSTSQGISSTPKVAQPVTLNQPPVLSGPSMAEMPSRRSFEEAKKRHDLLSGQLSRLDRYTALHSWEIDPESKKLFVQQRMSLVKELDTIRLYREQLDVIYGGSHASALSDKAQTVPIHQTQPKSCRPGKFTSKHAPRTLPLFLSGSHSADPGCTTPGLVVPPAHPIHGSFEQPFVKQSMEDANGLSHNAGVKTIPSGCESLTESNLLYNEQIRQADFAPVKRALHAQTIKAAFPDDTGRGTVLQNGTSQLQKLFNRIEAANTRCEPVDGLLRELSVVTAGLINDRSKQDDGTGPRIFGRQVPPTHESQTAGHPSINDSSYVPEKYRGMQHIRRFWESEPSPEICSKKLRDVSPETDDETHSRPPSSHVSTTDSWTTVNKGE
ncbi:phosphoglycerate mutase-like protein [Aspergillus steynii IBT 23096]|uniref:Phosphoglycerate mutase-like protein n=1 Tax=Aspergillus steynii IBT 23096 TaxID=1392250 RepID=A0A2I2G2Z6_9EURO|nr:phosphoglycerate mutase-like protein [Aspergillus steynii IBT 23096]PLB47248.1 phosphoglycerate mutase-like protein [Aspergillus steynii IBT 23096]